MLLCSWCKMNKEKIKISWYQTDKDYKDNIMTSVIGNLEDKDDILNAIKTQQR